MKPTPKSAPETGARNRAAGGSNLRKLLAFGAHPDDIEFGCGGVIAGETQAGREVRFVVCSRGEAASNGTAAERTTEAEKSAERLGATIEFLDLGGDAHFEVKVEHTLKLAEILRRERPALVLAPSLAPNQHPDHPRLGQMVRDATRLARYGGVKRLRPLPPHAVEQLFYYAVTPEAEPTDLARVLVDVSAPEVLAVWTAAMEAHASQARTRNYVELQLTRARLNGLRAGIGQAIPLFPNDPLVIDSLARVGRGARAF
ncbi:MAG TPA: PIG-L family deacetylase [Candidatus Acidoferrum sp.]|jgi:LmbE family N-acetylglucosaminyl deacetylase|nr:PIG-L family deacetylase [Candidatus Acidoferrum sp.]